MSDNSTTACCPICGESAPCSVHVHRYTPEALDAQALEYQRRKNSSTDEKLLHVLEETRACLDAAKDMAAELQKVIGSIQRSSFDAGYDACARGEDRMVAYKEWTHT
jgi:hypothetical protein